MRKPIAYDAGTAVVVGVNAFVAAESAGPDVFQIDPAIERLQIDRVRAVRAGRSEQEWRAALDGIDAAARGSDNLVPVIITAVEKHATLGEIADTMRRVFGEYRES